LTTAEHRAGHALTLASIVHRFGTFVAVSDVTLDFAPGELVALLGPSGCGKTTVLRLVAGLEHPSTGRVTIDAASPAAARRAKRIGFVPQAPALLPWRTVAANARLLRDLRADANPALLPDPDALLADVGLEGFVDAYPHELSGGMQQRVALVRAFALGARYLLMDEPFAALDEITRADMRHLLANLCEPVNAAVLFVTHSIAEAVFLSDRVIVMSPRPGRILSTVDVDLPRPRVPETEDDPAFFEYERQIRAMLHTGAGR
jgi:NitT/TauT family transport system ATP-binding protein